MYRFSRKAHVKCRTHAVLPLSYLHPSFLKVSLDCLASCLSSVTVISTTSPSRRPGHLSGEISIKIGHLQGEICIKIDHLPIGKNLHQNWPSIGQTQHTKRHSFVQTQHKNWPSIGQNQHQNMPSIRQNQLQERSLKDIISLGVKISTKILKYASNKEKVVPVPDKNDFI